MAMAGIALIALGTVARVAVGAVPPARAGVAVVDVKVAGDRESPTTVSPLAGVTFGLFRTEPTAFEPVTGFATAPPLYTCASDPQGDCAFEVPLGSAGVAEGSRLWVAPVAGPAGWFANPVWQTAPLTGTTGRNLTRHVFQTPALYSGQRYVSGSGGFMGEPGVQTSPANTASEYTRRIDSSGVWPLARMDPPLSERCGLNVALVVDLSSSMNGSVGALKGTMNSFVEALRGTPSQSALYTFSTDTPAVAAGPNSGLMPVATEADTKRFKALYEGWGNATANGYTNWDRGIAAVAAANGSPDPSQHFDLVVLLTDGNPTDYGPIAGVPPSRSGFTRFRELENAVASANLLKGQGTRVLAIGVGEGLDEGAERNLRSISGVTGYSPTTPIGEVAYLRAENFAAVAKPLRELFISGCAPSISVIKQIVPNGGTIADAYTPSEPWEFSAETTTPGATIEPPAASTSQATGALNFDLTFPGLAAEATVHEIPGGAQSTYELVQVGGKNATCVDKTAEDAPVEVTNAAPRGFEIEVGLEAAVSCVVYNREPAPPEPAQVVVGKRWKLTTAAGTTELEDGEQPPSLQGFLAMDGPAGAPSTAQPWGVERTSYEAGEALTLGETTDLGLPGCTLDGVTLEGTGLPTTPLPPSAPESTVTLAGGLNEYTVTNEVSCLSRLFLRKEVLGGPASPTSWTLRAIGPEGAIPGPAGPTGSGGPVSDGAVYQLAEEPASADPSLLDYAQRDNRERPLSFPLSTGSMRCDVLTGPLPGETGIGFSSGGEGSVQVPLGQDVECVATNQIAQLTLVKRVVGGTASPGDFSFTVAPVDPVIAGLATKQAKGAPAPGTTIDIRPEQQYRITESGAPGYTLSDLTCDVGGTEQPGATLTIPAGAAATCTATNTSSATPPPPGGTQGKHGKKKKKKHKRHKHARAHGRIALDKTASRAKVRPGQGIHYRIVVRSLGPAAAKSVRVCDRFPDALVLLRAPHATRDEGRLCWVPGKLAAGSRRVYRVMAAAPRSGSSRTIRNVAVADGANVHSRKAGADVRLVAPQPEPPRFTG